MAGAKMGCRRVLKLIHSIALPDWYMYGHINSLAQWVLTRVATDNEKTGASVKSQASAAHECYRRELGLRSFMRVERLVGFYFPRKFRL